MSCNQFLFVSSKFTCFGDLRTLLCPFLRVFLRPDRIWCIILSEEGWFVSNKSLGFLYLQYKSCTFCDLSESFRSPYKKNLVTHDSNRRTTKITWDVTHTIIKTITTRLCQSAKHIRWSMGIQTLLPQSLFTIPIHYRLKGNERFEHPLLSKSSSTSFRFHCASNTNGGGFTKGTFNIKLC